MKKLFSVLVSAMMILSTVVIPVHAEETDTTTVTAQLYGRIEDNGQAIHKVVLDYGEVELSDVAEDTYTVHAKTSSLHLRPETEVAYGDYDEDRTIVKVVTNGSKVEIYMDESAYAGTLSYLAGGARNVPTKINYSVTQVKPVTTKDGSTIENPTIKVDNTVIDEETAKFEAVDDEIDYQFYDAGDADSLIVWFHGNGEGDYVINGEGTHNNVAQMLANRGTVAWATEEAQEIFGGAHVMSFQAPDTWYYAQKDGLLEMAHDEIMEVVAKYGIDPAKILVSGCSAGGYMTTRMIIAYPDLFAAAMINCPALDVATARGGETPTDEELATIKESRTAIWLVQGETDATVQTKDCSIRLFNILTEGQEIIETRVDQEIQSGFITKETKDGKYKMSLYDTTEDAKLKFAEDFDQDGIATYTEFSNHWSWIYTLRNNPTDADETTIWEWAASKAVDSNKVAGTAKLNAIVTDAGEVVNQMVIEFSEEIDNVDEGTFTVHAEADTDFITEGTEVISYGDYSIDRKITSVEVNGKTVTINFLESEGATLAYLSSGRNYPAKLTYTVTPNEIITSDGEVVEVSVKVNEDITNEETENFKSVIVEDGINYQFFDAGKDADSLIVWFHGNGEGDYLDSDNNVAQMLANRGTVAWATEEAQKIFGGAHVMAFQAPDHWYNAKNNGLLEMAHDEIMAVVEEYGIDPAKILVSGCSAGGFMTTRMIIAYPNLFAAAMINCPALDIANDRAGEGVTDATPTDEELESIKKSRTAIWLVQGETDSSVQPEECSMRMFDILTAGEKVTETRVEQDIQSSYTTYETEDGKYKMSIYDTVIGADGAGKLEFAEDYNNDGELELVQYSNHWSWIYTLRNNPTDADETTIWEWAASKAVDSTVVNATAQLHAIITDAGEVVNKMVIDLGKAIDTIDVDTLTVHAEADTDFITEGTEVISYGDYSIDRKITSIEVNGKTITIHFNEAEGATLAYLSSARNYPAKLTYTVTPNEIVTSNGEVIQLNVTVKDAIINEETENFESVIVKDGINYQFYNAGKDADSLIVWFHGNGEGDYLNSDNNVAQMLANRGTVAWATEEAQEIFGGAHVMSFQAPDTWYYAQKDGLLEMAHDEIMEVVAKYGIDPAKILVSGCSAGGYMTTRMIIAYPDLFAAAMINCPALDVATARGGETPTDEELATIKDSRTAIWLVQGETDATVKTEDCSIRLFNILTEGEEIIETRVDQEIQSGYTTYETEDGKYKMSLYDTTEDAKLNFAEDYNNDGELELVQYSNHWSWIYTLRNNPTDADETTIWEWAAEIAEAEAGTMGSVQTGDNANIMPLATMAVVALLGAVIAFRKKEEISE